MWDKWAQGTHEKMLGKGRASLLVLNSELGDGWLSNYKPLALVQRIKFSPQHPHLRLPNHL